MQVRNDSGLEVAYSEMAPLLFRTEVITSCICFKFFTFKVKIEISDQPTQSEFGDEMVTPQ